MALDLEIILRETAANFAATVQLPELEKSAKFAKIPNGTKKSFNGQEYELINSRWHRVDNGDLLENNLEKADRDETAAEDKITRSEDRQARKELMDSLAKEKPYTMKMVDGGHEITKAGNTLDLGDMKITRSPQTIKITPDGSGHRVDIGAGSSTVLSGGVTTNYDSPAQSHQFNNSPIKISAGSSQLQIHDFLYHPDRGVLKKSDGKFAQFGKSVIKKPAAKKKNCKPTSISCGFSCISGQKVCRITMTMEQQKAYKALKKELRDSKKVGSKDEPPVVINKSKESTFKTTAERDKAVKTAINDLDFEYNLNGLIKLHELRARIGSGLNKADFDKHILDMQKRDQFRLISLGENDTTETLDGGIESKISGIRSAISTTYSKKERQSILSQQLNDPIIYGKDRKINTAEKFNTAFASAFQQSSTDGLAYIADIRKSLGDQVDRKDFNKWLYQNENYQLVEGSVKTAGDTDQRDAITTPLNGLRTYVKQTN